MNIYEEFNNMADKTVERIGKAISKKYGADNTFGLCHWEGFEVCFQDDDGKNITVDERTLEIIEY